MMLAAGLNFAAQIYLVEKNQVERQGTQEVPNVNLSAGEHLGALAGVAMNQIISTN